LKNNRNYQRKKLLIIARAAGCLLALMYYLIGHVKGHRNTDIALLKKERLNDVVEQEKGYIGSD
jgi:hypothetical protein